MLYPKFLKDKDTIGITAPSQEVGDNIESFKNYLATVTKYGYQIKKNASVRNKGIASTTREKRSKELAELITDTKIKMIICAIAGDFLVDMLPSINWENIRKNPK